MATAGQLAGGWFVGTRLDLMLVAHVSKGKRPEPYLDQLG